MNANESKPAEQPRSDGARRLNLRMAVAVWAVGVCLLCYQATPVLAGLFFVPFSLGPHALTHFGAWIARSAKAQATLMVALLAYAAWFLFVYSSAFYLSPDPQSPIALAFVGVYALPVLVPLWALATWFEAKERIGGSPA